MLSITHTSCKSTGDALERAVSVAEYYGFTSSEEVLKTRPLTPLGSTMPTPASTHDKALATHTKKFLERRNGTSDLLSMYSTRVHKTNGASVGLHSIGVRTAIAEASLISAMRTMLKTLGAQNPKLRIGSIGDRDSSLRFQRELSNFLRANIEDIPASAREDLRSGNPVRAMFTVQHKHPQVAQHAPSPVDYLNEESRTHLHDVLEYLEVLDIPYELDPHIIGTHQYWTHTLFEIDAEQNGEATTVARGGRVGLSKSLRLDVPQVSAFMDYEIKGRTSVKPKKAAKPKFYFAQIGPLAKRLSFSILHTLHEAGIPVHQSITTETMTPQMKDAQKHNVPYVLIMGHKEALENTIIVRNTETLVQHVVLQRELASYLRRLKV